MRSAAKTAYAVVTDANQYWPLSNHWPRDIVLGGNIYCDGVAALWGETFSQLAAGEHKPARRKWLAEYAGLFVNNARSGLHSEAIAAVAVAGLTPREESQLSAIQLTVQRAICAYKYAKYPTVANTLNDLRDCYIIYAPQGVTQEPADFRWQGCLVCTYPDQCEQTRIYGLSPPDQAAYVYGTIAVVGENQLGREWMRLVE